MFGNLLGASGALDVIIALLAMEHSLIPPTLNLRDPDPVWLNYVKDKALERRVDKALVISRGRGGINSALVVEKA
jgi:3-oxoacyl-(acyl-carrier-protein) synthase